MGFLIELKLCEVSRNCFFKPILKVSAFYLEKQKSFIPKKNVFLSRTAKVDPKYGVSRLNYQWRFCAHPRFPFSGIWENKKYLEAGLSGGWGHSRSYKQSITCENLLGQAVVWNTAGVGAGTAVLWHGNLERCLYRPAWPLRSTQFYFQSF